jgi:DNA-binding transcriptional MerR regulator
MHDEHENRVEQACFPIRTVVAETGVNAITLRAWERRFGLITPVRTESGHRLYSRADIDLVRRIMVLQDKGIPVSRAIAWLKQHPEEPLLPALAAAMPSSASPDAAPNNWTQLRARMLDAVARFDDFDMDTVWNDAVEQFPPDVVTHFLLLPVGTVLNEQQAGGETRRAVLNFYWAFLRNRLGARFANQSRDAQGVRVVLSAAPGSHADIALLLTGIALAQQGLRPMLFAPGTPLAELAQVLRRSRARALLLMADALPPSSLFEEIAPIARAGFAVFAGGETLAPAQERLRSSGAVYLDGDPVNAARLMADILGGRN